MKNKIVSSPEILTALLSANVGESIDEFKADAKGYLAEHYGIDASAIDISVEENSANQIHLPLPYYTGLEEASAKAMQDAEMQGVEGGDIGVGLFIFATIILPIIVSTVTATAGATAAGVILGTENNGGK